MKLGTSGISPGFTYGCIAGAALLGVVSFHDVYLGLVKGADVYFQMAQAYGGSGLVFLSFGLVEFDIIHHPKRFVAF